MRSWKFTLLVFVLLAVMVMACGTINELLTPEATTPPATPEPQNSVAEMPTEQPQSQLTVVSPTAETMPAIVATPEVITTKSQELESAPADPKQHTFDLLVNARPPERDQIEVARLYEGWTGSEPQQAEVNETLPLGTIQNVNVLNRDTITIDPIEVELLAVGERAYFWFDTGDGSVRPSPGELDPVAQAFDEIYEQIVIYFGPENSPGVDGDSRVHVINASPLALCDVTLDAIDSCGAAGYFRAFDAIPKDVDPDSNAREMFVMNANFFYADFYLSVLAHELRHMIEDNHDRGDADWEAEGSATLAQDLVGFGKNGRERGNMFLAEPDQQLNSWTDGFTLPYYGQGFLLNRYIFDRMGQEYYREFATSQESGLKTIDSLSAASGFDLSGQELWLDWLATLVIHDEENVPEKYQLHVEGLDSPTMVQVEDYPASFTDTVHQYAADYYHLTSDETGKFNFSGDALVQMLDAMPASGEHMWLANRANFGHLTLSREVDLRDVESATLEYDVYHDIEIGYDFAYVFVSEDGGQSWQPLLAENMQGLNAEDDPAEAAIADRFYTGRSDGWRKENIDLTPYSGKEIQIRFTYLTDLILTFGGIAFDNVAIPEIGFFDDVETAHDGWMAEGFDRVSGQIPQQWHLQLITFPDGVPTVQTIPVSDQNMAELALSLTESGGEAILIIAASAPMTLETAGYELEFSSQ